MVGAIGFEPTTPRPPGECATGLRHAPTLAACSQAAPVPQQVNAAFGHRRFRVAVLEVAFAGVQLAMLFSQT